MSLTETIEEKLSKIINRFRERDMFSSSSSNKENSRFIKELNRALCSPKQELNKTKNRVKYLQNLVQTLISDGNSMSQYFLQIQRGKEQQKKSYQYLLNKELQAMKYILKEQRSEFETDLKKCKHEIEDLRRKYLRQAEDYRQMQEKYDILKVKVAEDTQQQKHQILIYCQEINRETYKFQENLSKNQDDFEKMKLKLKKVQIQYERVWEQNQYLKEVNHKLSEELQQLQMQRRTQNQQTSQVSHDNNQCEVCDLQSIQHNDTYSFEYDEKIVVNDDQNINIHDDQNINLNNEKEILNISEHYSKCNLTRELFSKEKSNQDCLTLLNIDQQVSKDSFIRKRQPSVDHQISAQANRRQLQSLQRHQIIKHSNRRPNLAGYCNKNSKSYANTYKNSAIKQEEEEKQIRSKVMHEAEVKQFKIAQPVERYPSVDPYYAFFVLLVQSCKINSKHFNYIAHQNVNYLYQRFIKTNVTYNLWQRNIEQQLSKKKTKSSIL